VIDKFTLPRRRLLSIAFVVTWLMTGLYHSLKPLPPGTHVDAGPFTARESDVDFLVDTTRGDDGQRNIDQHIFDAVFGIIDRASEFVVMDFFLINDDRGSMPDARPPHRALSGQFIERLLARKRALPDLKVLLVTDPVNDVYGAIPNDGLAALRAAGIDVVVTRLGALRDPNPLYSGLYRMLIGWWIGDGSGGLYLLPNPMEDGPVRVSLRSWLTLLNLKANHRKVIAADDGAGGQVAIVTSANPHDASSAHSNVAVRVSGPIVASIVESEMEIARFSGWQPTWTPKPSSAPADDGNVTLQYLTEGAIAEASLDAIARAGDGDAIDIAMFYLSDRRYVDAIAAAARRGAAVRIILDPSKDAFGRTKDGLPNRPVAAELLRRGNDRITVRWYRTHGEQFHTKVLAIRTGERMWICLGSANLTRRNVGDFNLEANVAMDVDAQSEPASEVTAWFERLWANDVPDGTYTDDYQAFADGNGLRYWRYRLMEATGLSTW
jgi:phosphatidylserine/phosphatidylglycerophosphate/cardiolipin synthase-like enzyme